MGFYFRKSGDLITPRGDHAISPESGPRGAHRVPHSQPSGRRYNLLRHPRAQKLVAYSPVTRASGRMPHPTAAISRGVNLGVLFNDL